MDGLEAHLGEGNQIGHHNSAISRCRFRRAGATGGGRDGRMPEIPLMRLGRRISAHAPEKNRFSFSYDFQLFGDDLIQQRRFWIARPVSVDSHEGIAECTSTRNSPHHYIPLQLRAENTKENTA